MLAWLAKPALIEPDADADYAAVIEIDMDAIKEPILACPNDPDDVKPLSAVAGAKIDEVFIGSCMTNIGHFRAAGHILAGAADLPTRLWVAPPTRMDAEVLSGEGYYAMLGKAGARMEIPGCSLCMGNQAQIRKGSTAISTSTRNFPNRLGIDTQRLSRLGGTGGGVRGPRPHPDHGRVRSALGPGRQEGGRDLPLHELRPDPRVLQRGLTLKLGRRRNTDRLPFPGAD